MSPATAVLSAVGDTVRLVAAVADANGQPMTGTAVSWLSSDTLVATVGTDGLVTAAGPGMTTIRAAAGSAVGNAEVTVAPTPSAVAVSPATARLAAIGDTVRLAAAVADANGHPITNIAVTWSSADTLVAAVDSVGLVTAAGNGTTRIEAAVGDVTGTAEVTVRQRPAAVSLSPASLALGAVGDTARLAARVADANGHAIGTPAVAWASTNAAVAAVDDAGLVTATGIGTAAVTASSGAATDTAEVVVLRISSDRDVLEYLYRTSGGEAWTQSDGWLSDRPLAEWHGVRTDADGRVTYLWLPDNHLSGPIPGLLGRLERLELLNLSYNALTGEWPAAWRNLLALRDLRMAGNAVEGRLPSWLGDLDALVGLALSGNDMSGELPPAVGKLANLRHLSLGDNGFTGAIPAEWGGLRSLEYLDLTRTDLTGPLPLSFTQLTALQRFYFHGTRVCAPQEASFQTWLASLQEHSEAQPCIPVTADRDVLVQLYEALGGPRWRRNAAWLSDEPLNGWHGVETDADGYVTELSLQANNLRGRLPPSIGDLTRLRALRLFDNELEGEIPSEIGNLGQLLVLSLADNPLEGPIPAAIGRLAELDTLYIAGTAVSGPIPPEIGNLTKLRRLALFENRLSGTLPAALGELANLRDLWLSNNALSGGIPAEIGRLSRLASLSLGGNGLSGAIPRELGNLSSLRRLDLWDNELSGEIPRELGGLRELETLSMQRNHLTGPIPRALGNLSGLTHLALFGNRLTGPIPRELGRLGKLQRLWVGGNPISGPIPPELGNLSALIDLDVSSSQVSGPIPDEIANIRGLQFFFAFGSRISGRLPAALAEIETLTRLNVSNTRLHGMIPRGYVNSGLSEFAYSDTDLCPHIDDAFRRWRISVSPDEPVCEPTTVERLVLEEFHENTGGGSWTNESGWLSSQPVGGWHGVTTGAGGRVTAVALPDNGLEGELLADVANFTMLETLDVARNALRGNVPAEFGTLTRLQELRLEGNQGLEGAVPFSLTTLRGLRQFRFGGTGLCGPPAPTFQAWWATIADRDGATCDNVAQVRLSGTAYLTQSIQDLEGGVPLVAGRDALLRVFVVADRPGAYYEPKVVATFRRGGQVVHREEIAPGGDRIATEPDQSRLSGSYNAEISGEIIELGTELVVEIDPEGTVPLASESVTRLPAEGALALDIVTVPPLELTVVPVIERAAPDTTVLEWTRGLTEDAPQVSLFRYAFPFHEFTARSREAYYTDLDVTSENDQWLLVLELEAVRLLENGRGYYYGAALSPDGYVRGRARRPGWASIGKPWDTELAHEVGHNLSLRHAPCGGALNTDPEYPHAGGGIGVWGYDFRDGTLVSPRTRRDIMGYCYDQGWLSDFYYKKVIEHRQRVEATARARIAAGTAETDVLVLWGGRVADSLRLEPPFTARAAPLLPEREGRYRMQALRADGSEAFSFAFEPGEDKYGDRYFMFAVPVEPGWADAVDRFVLRGDGRAVTREARDGASVTVVRDRTTGEVRALLRDWDGALPAPLRGRSASLDVDTSAGLRRTATGR